MDYHKIDEQMRTYVEKNEMAGGALIIRCDGELEYKNKWGFADIKAQKSVEYNTIFKMASISKVFTAVGVLKLIENGKLGLDDKITKYIPAFENVRVAADERYTPEKFSFKKMLYFMLTMKADKIRTVAPQRSITVRDLLTHSSGINMGLVGIMLGMKMKGAKEDSLPTRIEKWSKIPLDFQPQTATGYSLLGGFETLGYLCEVISGKRFAEYMHDEVFAPLGMKDATYHPNEEQVERVPRLYKTVKGKQKDVTDSKEDIGKMGLLGPNFASGAAGAYATVEDMDCFANMLATHGVIDGREILKSETVRSIYTERASNADLEFSPGMKWGLGMLVRDNPEKAGITTAKGTYGWSGAFGTHLFVVPERKLSVVFAMNRSDIGGASSYISKRLEELIFE